MPNAIDSWVRNVEKSFGVKIQFVQVDGVSRESGFAGIYAGGRVLYVNVEAKKAVSLVIGHYPCRTLGNSIR